MTRFKRTRTLKLPKVSEVVVYGHPVAGHAGTLADKDGVVFIKPATDQEIEFYQNIKQHYPQLAQLCSEYLGELTITENELEEIEARSGKPVNDGKLQKNSIPGHGHHHIGKHDASYEQKDIGSRKIPSTRYVCLESQTYGFKQPNIMDVKLGKILYDDEARQAKKDKFDIITKTTTHGTLGFRIAGKKVFQGHDGARNTRDVDHDGFEIYDKTYGLELAEDTIHEAFRTFLFEPKARVDADLGKYVAEGFLQEVEKMVKVLEGVKSEMRSASILFVYEGDGDVLRHEIEQEMKMDQGEAPQRLLREDETHGHAGSDASSEDDYIPRVYACKLIDFAHARIATQPSTEDPITKEVKTPQLERDENILVGIRNIAKILRQVKEEGPYELANGDGKTKRRKTAASQVNGSKSCK